MGDSSNAPITCTVGRWYYKRMLLMALMLSVFGAWFLYDGAIGWPRKNEAAVAAEIFNASKEGASWEAVTAKSQAFRETSEGADEALMKLFRDAHAAGQTKMPWKDYARKTRIPENPDSGTHEASVREAFEAGGKDGATWADYALSKSLEVDPKEDKAVEIRRAYEAAGQRRDWAGFAFERGWGSKAPKYHTQRDIVEQFVIGGACLAGALIAIVLLLRNRTRTLTADGESFTTGKGVRVPFESVYRIDKRKWDNKGLAYVWYRGEGESKTVIDDLKYEGASDILDRLLANVQKCELIERADASEDAAEDAERAPETSEKGGDPERPEPAEKS